MKTPNEFWLCLHRLATAYEAEGETSRERLENVLEQFRQMPPIARREILADFALIAGSLNEIYMAAVATHNQMEKPPQAAAREGAA